MSITRAQIARQLLAQGGMSLNDAQMMAPDGEFLAYINSKEADMLKQAGGSGIMTPMGIPSYMDLGNEQQMNENLSAAGGGRGGSQNQTGGDTDDIYQQSSNTNQAIAKANRSIGQKIVDSIKGISNFTPFGIARKGLGFLFDKFKNLRGGLTQKQFEDARRERQRQNRISKIMGRDAPFTEMTLENLRNLGYTGPLDGLLGTTNVTRSGTTDDVYPDRVDGIVSQVGTNPNVKSMMGEYFNVPIENRIGSTFGINPNNIDLAGLNQKQVDYLNKIDQMNKNVGNTGFSTTNKSLRNPNNPAGAFFEYKSPQEVLDTVMGLNKKSSTLFNNVDPDKNVYGDKSTFAQPNEITNYIQSLSPEDRTYSFGIPQNEPGKNYLELFKGGFIK